MREHLNKIDNEDEAEVYFHFNGGDCCKKDVSFRVLDYVYDHPNSKRAKSLRINIENNWIQRLKTQAPKGLNIIDSRFG